MVLKLARIHFSIQVTSLAAALLSLPIIYTFCTSTIGTGVLVKRLTNFDTCDYITKVHIGAKSCGDIMPASTIDVGASMRPPTYFLSIGGPNTIELIDHPAYTRLQAIGKEITTKVKPKAIVVFSGHWQAGPNNIQINVSENAPIEYDFMGFPKRYYEYKFPNRGNREIAEKVIEKLTSANIEVERVQRGLDHGIWAGFLVAFNPLENPLDVPIVQVSLYDNEDSDRHYRMGQALESLRDEGILIMGTGMAVHNTRDYRNIVRTGKTMPYAYSFDDALKSAATSEPKKRQGELSALLKRPDARKAHPTLDHILPMHVVAGAAGTDVGEQVWTYPDGCLSWAQYRFGNASA